HGRQANSTPRWRAGRGSVRIQALIDTPDTETAMRNKALIAGVCAVVGAGLLWFAAQTGARPAAKEEKEARSASLPIGEVVLCASGVGFFQRQGTVEGNARVDLSFPVSDINDLLKSMVLRDLDGGHVSAVSYDSNAPVDRTLRSFAVDLTRNP